MCYYSNAYINRAVLTCLLLGKRAQGSGGRVHVPRVESAGGHARASPCFVMEAVRAPFGTHPPSLSGWAVHAHVRDELQNPEDEVHGSVAVLEWDGASLPTPNRPLRPVFVT